MLVAHSLTKTLTHTAKHQNHVRLLICAVCLTTHKPTVLTKTTITHAWQTRTLQSEESSLYTAPLSVDTKANCVPGIEETPVGLCKGAGEGGGGAQSK